MYSYVYFLNRRNGMRTGEKANKQTYMNAGTLITRLMLLLNFIAHFFNCKFNDYNNERWSNKSAFGNILCLLIFSTFRHCTQTNCRSSLDDVLPISISENLCMDSLNCSNEPIFFRILELAHSFHDFFSKLAIS